MLFFQCFHDELIVVQLLISISIRFLGCFLLQCFLSTITSHFNFTNITYKFQGIPIFSTVYENMASKIKPPTPKEDTIKKTDESSFENRKDEQSKSSSYLLYTATIIAVLGAIASTTQVDTLNDFIEEFSTSFCASSLIGDIGEVANETASELQELGLSSKFDPILKDGESYNALNAINSR